MAPWSASTWCAPLESFALAATRLASWRRAGAGDAAWLGVRAGTTAGLAARTLRADTANDLTAVAQALVDGAHQAASEQTEFTFRECLLFYTIQLFSGVLGWHHSWLSSEDSEG